MGVKLGKHYLTRSLREIRLPEKYADWSFDNNRER